MPLDTGLLIEGGKMPTDGGAAMSYPHFVLAVFKRALERVSLDQQSCMRPPRR
jgi:hypothetical protein